RISRICIMESGVNLDRLPEAYWELCRDRLPLYLWAPYLFTKVPLMVPYATRTGVHPKAVVNYCLFLLLSFALDRNPSHLSKTSKLLALLGQEAEVGFQTLAATACALCRTLNGLALKPHTPWVLYP